LLDRLKDKEALHFFGDVVAQAAEHMVFVLDELEDEELKESYRLIVGLTTVFKVGKEHFEKLVQWETELAERIKARGLKTTTTDRKIDELRRNLDVTREEMTAMPHYWLCYRHTQSDFTHGLRRLAIRYLPSGRKRWAWHNHHELYASENS
jgi:hypothetical protein